MSFGAIVGLVCVCCKTCIILFVWHNDFMGDAVTPLLYGTVFAAQNSYSCELVTDKLGGS